MIAALAGLVLAVTALVLVLRKGFKRVDAKFGKAELSLEAVDRKLDDVLEKAKKIEETGDKVNLAVNNVPPGTATLVQRVGSLEAGHQDLLNHQRWEADALCKMALQIGVPLQPPPIERRVPPTTGEVPLTTVDL